MPPAFRAVEEDNIMQQWTSCSGHHYFGFMPCPSCITEGLEFASHCRRLAMSNDDYRALMNLTRSVADENIITDIGAVLMEQSSLIYWHNRDDCGILFCLICNTPMEVTDQFSDNLIDLTDIYDSRSY